MDEPMGELRLIGRSASAGFAVGPIALLSRFNVMVRKGGEPAAEAAALRDAIATALEHLSQLAAHAKSDGADILAFQIAMLEDETQQSARAQVLTELGAQPSTRRSVVMTTPRTSTFVHAPTICATYASVCSPPYRAK
jgi:phosphotransferase system enzyme I (PtsI)